MKNFFNIFILNIYFKHLFLFEYICLLQINVECATIPLLRIVCKYNLMRFDNLTKRRKLELKRKG